MFKRRKEFYDVSPNFPGRGKSNVVSLLNPEKIEKDLEKEGQLSKETKERVDSVTGHLSFKDPFIFNVGTYPSAKLIPEGEYPIKMDLERKAGEKYLKTPSKTRVIVKHPSKDETRLFSISSQTKMSSKILNQIKRDENSILTFDEIRALEGRAKENTKKLSTPFMVDYDPEEVRFFQNLSDTYNLGINNTRLTQNYFMQMASLFLTGSFADFSNNEKIYGIQGLTEDGKSKIIGVGKNPGSYEGWSDKKALPSPEELSKFEATLNQDTPWYRNELFKRNISLERIVSVCNQLGGIFRKEHEDHSAVNLAAIADESLVSAIYESLRDKNCKGEDFVSKLKYLNKNLQDSGLLDPFISIYTDKKTNPANIRGDMMHVGTFRSNGNDAAYVWAAEFYTDLAKTLLSGIAQEGIQYTEFDHYARNTGIVTSDSDSVAYIPKTTSLRNKPSTEKEEVEFKDNNDEWLPFEEANKGNKTE